MSDATRDATVRLGAEVDPYKREMAAAAQETDKLAASVEKLVTKLDGLTKRAGKKLMLFGAGGAAGITAIGVEAASFEKKLSVLNATAVITDKNMGAVTKQIKSLTRELPVTRDEAVSLINAMDKLGVSSGKNLRIVSESATKLSAATGESLTGLTTQMVELQKQMGTLNAGTMDVFANSLLQVSKNAGVSAGGVLSFAQAIAPAARAAEMSQASVIGVSAAFTQAGADGYAAASTFSTMLADITRQIATGSPEVSKYSNLLGVTSEQFKRMDKGEALAGIFEAINKQGPDAIKTLDRLGYDGVRALKSIQAVSQSGGLRQAIAEATGAYQTTGALDSGSAAAMDGLFDELTRTKSMMQEIATEAGQPVLRLFTGMASGANELGQALVPVVGGLAQVATVVGGLGSLTGLGLGGAMALAGVKGTVALAGTVAKGTPLRGFGSGIGVARAMAGGGLPATGTRAFDAMDRYTAGNMRWWERAGFLGGMGFGSAFGGGGAGAAAGGTGRMLAAPFAAARMVMNAQRDFYRAAPLDGINRPAPLLGNVGNLSRALDPRNFREFIAGFRSGVPAADIKGLAGAARDPEDYGRRLRELSRATVANTAASHAHLSVSKQLTVQAGMTAKAFLQLQVAGVKAAGSLIGQGAVGAARGLGGALYGALGANPWMAGIMATGAIGAFAYSNRNQGSVEVGESAPIDKYNAALGIATSELGTFTDAVMSATKALPTPPTMGSAQQVSQDVMDLARMPKRQLTNDLFANFKFGSSRAAMMQLMGIDDPRQLQLVQADIAQERGKDQAQKATDIFFKRTEAGAGINYGALVRDIDAEQGQGVKGALGMADPTAGKMIQSIFDQLSGNYGRDAKQFNSNYANAIQVRELQGFLGSALGSNLGIEYGPLGPKTTGGRTATAAVKQFEKTYLGDTRTGFNAADFAKATEGMTDSEVGEYFFTDFLGKNSSKKVRKRIGELEEQGVDFSGMTMDQIDDLKFSNPSAYRRSLLGTGTIGRVALQNDRVQAAVDNPQDVNAQYQGVNEFLNQAQKLGSGFAGVDAELQKIKAAAKDASDPLYQLANSAQALNTQQRASAMQYMGRTGRMAESIGAFRETVAGDRNAPDYRERVDQRRQEVEQQKKSYYDYMVGIVQAQKNFAIQQSRAEEEMNISISRANEDFRTGMLHAEQDYYLSRQRSQRDFAISMAHQTEDFHRSMARQEEDFGRSMERQAEDTAAGIMDPFSRTQIQYTMSAASVMENMRNQNRMINDQVDNVKKLEQLGLKQSTIDILKLADPANAQQTARLVEDMQANPNLASGMNRRAGRRREASDALTQSPLSQQYRRTIEDFERGVRRATNDFERGQERANEANARMLSDMAQNFETMTNRAEEAHSRALGRQAADYKRQTRNALQDLARMQDEVTGSFGEVMVEATDLITQNMGKMGDKIVKEIDKIKKKFPELFEDLYKEQDPRRGLTQGNARAAEAAAIRGGRTFSSPSRGGSGGGTTVYDHSTTITGSFKVEANDPADLTKKLADQARLNKLTRGLSQNR